MAEWTGDARDGMFSGVVITQFHTGQIDNKPYFCIEGKQSAGSSISACSMKNSSVWGLRFPHYTIKHYIFTQQASRSGFIMNPEYGRILLL